MFLSSDIDHAYLFTINTSGKLSHEEIKLDSQRSIVSDSTFYAAFRSFVFKRFGKRLLQEIPLHPNVRDRDNRKLEVYGTDATFRFFAPSDKNVQNTRDANTSITAKGWYQSLEGYLHYDAARPTGILSWRDDLYVAVTNADISNCGKGPDRFPIIYKIDQATGAIRWQTTLPIRSR